MGNLEWVLIGEKGGWRTEDGERRTETEVIAGQLPLSRGLGDVKTTPGTS